MFRFAEGRPVRLEAQGAADHALGLSQLVLVVMALLGREGVALRLAQRDREGRGECLLP